ncbi:MAG: hypothetical protein JNJ57_15690 [Saprospiraceae bacterium]|nr:hypothetical protein [Saprospiraceae bacterium]
MAIQIKIEAPSVHTNCPPPSSGPGNTSDNCVEKWRQEKDAAKRDLDQKIAEVDQAKKELENAIAWEGKLKTWYDNVVKTAELSDKLRRELSVMISQVEKLCENSACTVEALKCLYFMVETIYNESVSSILNILELLQKCIRCISNPQLIRDKGITKAINDLEIKIKELDALHLDALKKVIEALKCALILQYSLCEDPDVAQDFSGDALLCDLYDLEQSLGGPMPDASGNLPKPRNCKASDLDSGPWACCVNEEELVDRPTFPLEEDDYYRDIEGQYDQAKTDKNDAKDKYDNLKKQKEAKQACYESLSGAIETADKTNNGK